MVRDVSFKLAAIDIDDTLIGPDGEISAANQAAVAELRDRGVLVVLASGRNHASMFRFHRQLGLGEGPLVSNHGAVVEEATSGVRWFEQPVPAAETIEATRDAVARGYRVVHHRREGIFVQEGGPSTAEYEVYAAKVPVPHVVVPDLLWTGGEGVFKVMWFADPELIPVIAPGVRAHYAGRLTSTETEPGQLEFTCPSVSKAVALDHVARRLGVSARQVMAFGDGNNDVPMLEWAGLGVAMSNARESAKAAADLVAPEGDPETSLARGIDLVLRTRF